MVYSSQVEPTVREDFEDFFVDSVLIFDREIRSATDDEFQEFVHDILQACGNKKGAALKTCVRRKREQIKDEIERRFRDRGYL